MRHPALAIGTMLLLLAPLVGCTTAAGEGAPTSSSTATDSGSEEAAALEQAQAWLDAATLPPGAVRSSVATGSFTSYQGWPCGPTARLEAFWTVPDLTVAEAANWLMANPTADLVSTGVGPVPDVADIGEVNVGYIPSDDSQQGIVYTVAKRDDGVAVRAQIAALTESAVCPSLPPGTSLGKPGQG
ncbi:hypothetical protein ACTU3I_08350 [Microbacterium sp. RD1]|uniref:hypothetical protein n=1 Tax=Microbacterium sp. RD1 TaxID=3457313 RepID=UPI003FA57A36